MSSVKLHVAPGLPVPRLGLLVGALFAGLTASAQVVVFQDTSPVPGGPFSYLVHGGREHGNEVVLEPATPRSFHSLSLSYFYSGTGGATAVVRFYELDGPALPPPLGVNTPGTELYESLPLSLGVSAGIQMLTLTDSGAFVLPDRVAYTVEFSLSDGEDAGLILAGGAASAGSAEQGFWELGVGGWELLEFVIDRKTYSTFAATLTAVPEPAHAAAGAALLLAGTAGASAAMTYSTSASVGYDIPKPDASSPFPLGIVLPQFNDTLVGFPGAVLVGIELTFISCVQLDNLGLENTSASAGDITFTQVLNSTFEHPTPVTNPTHTTTPLNPTVSFTQSFPAYDGTTDFGGTSGKTFTIPADAALLEKCVSTGPFFVAAADWAPYVGPGNFTISYDATINLPTVTGDAGKTFAFMSPDALARGEVLLTFHYVPETSNVAAGAALALLLGAAGWRMRRRS